MIDAICEKDNAKREGLSLPESIIRFLTFPSPNTRSAAFFDAMRLKWLLGSPNRVENLR